MFYSHEILTSRKHGVATIWLVATLGSKSNLKKVSRRAILDVNVLKACETITDHDVPMALRLQGSLLFGVSRVFSQQCGYILSDTQSLRDKMRGVAFVMQDLQTDGNIAMTSNEQLNLAVDPNFDLDLDLGLDMSAFDAPTSASEQSSLLSPGSPGSTRSSVALREEVEPMLQWPSDNTPDIGFFDFGANEGMDTGLAIAPSHEASSILEGPAIDMNPLFEVDEEGHIIDRDTRKEQAEADAALLLGRSLDLPSDSGIDTGIATGHMSGTRDQLPEFLNFDDDYDVLVGDDVELPQPLVEQSTPPAAAADSVHEVMGSDFIASNTNREETVAAAEAPQRPTKPAKILQIDQATELSGRQIGEWSTTYTHSMARARKEKDKKQSLAQARKNAAFWVLDQGIGGVSANLGNDREPHPLSVFSGQTLLELLTGQGLSIAGRKRSFDATEIESEHEAGRRPRPDVDEGLGLTEHHVVHGEDNGLLVQDDDIESEMGRRPASSLKDRPSLSMPWNLVASSHQGSAQGSSQRGVGSSAGRAYRSALSARRSRVTSASPLLGRDQPVPHLSSPTFEGHSIDSDMFKISGVDFGDLSLGVNERSDVQFEQYNPAATAGSRQSMQSQMLAETLKEESQNFLLFLNEQIRLKLQDNASATSIWFKELLPPDSNSDIVAAQGLLHVLTLATKGLIDVVQKEAFGDISLEVISGTEEYK